LHEIFSNVLESACGPKTFPNHTVWKSQNLYPETMSELHVISPLHAPLQLLSIFPFLPTTFIFYVFFILYLKETVHFFCDVLFVV